VYSSTEKLFGALEVDLHVPDDLKSKFVEMPPIFKNIEVSRDDIGDHMKTYAEERNVMNQPRKCLRVSDTIFFSGSASPARRASLMLSPNFWKQAAGVYSTT
jgi:hypothetical protein